MLEEVERVNDLLSGRDKDGRQAQLNFGCVPGAVAAPDFAVHDGRSNCLLGTPFGGVGQRVTEEREQVVEMILQMFRQPFVGGVRLHWSVQTAQSRREPAIQQTQSLSCQFVLPEAIAGCARRPEHVQHGVREPHRSDDGGFQQFVAAAYEVGQTLLMTGPSELAVDTPAVVDQRARVVLAKQQHGRLGTACRVDRVASCMFGCEVMQPRVLAVDPPARLVTDDAG